jgi:hypothetical protein
MTSPSFPPLPRAIEATPARDAIRARLVTSPRLLWRCGTVTVPVLPLEPIAAALTAAYTADHLVLGLERATETLAAEARGLALRRHAGSTPTTRVSRLLLLSDDGAERLYRHAESLMAAHASRLLVAILTASAVALGRATTGHDAAVKVVLLRHKHAVAALLHALAP